MIYSWWIDNIKIGQLVFQLPLYIIYKLKLAKPRPERATPALAAAKHNSRKGSLMDLMLLVTLTAFIALAFAFFTAKRLKKSDAGTEDVRKITAIIRRAANAFLKRQYRGVAIFFGGVFVILIIWSINNSLYT